MIPSVTGSFLKTISILELNANRKISKKSGNKVYNIPQPGYLAAGEIRKEVAQAKTKLKCRQNYISKQSRFYFSNFNMKSPKTKTVGDLINPY